MNIVMFTNTFTPHVGGVACSVQSFTDELRLRGHRVLVVAPTFDNTPEEEEDIIRVPALQNFNGSDFSVRLPIPANLTARLSGFAPDVVHSHHPFLLGDTAIRISRLLNLPIVFTHHTMYERYTHYVMSNVPQLENFASQLSTGYANLCHAVIAPSESVRNVIERRGVLTPIHVVPTGIATSDFAHGDRLFARKRYNIPEDAFLVGHVGRLAREKNLTFLAHAVIGFLRYHYDAHFLLVGSGPLFEELEKLFAAKGLGERVHLTGSLSGNELASAYRAMDVFAFASQTETQGIVLAEAMAAGVPVVAVDAPGVREVVKHGVNGALLKGQRRSSFISALNEVYELDEEELTKMRQEAQATAEEFSRGACAEALINVYEGVIGSTPQEVIVDDSLWLSTLRFLEAEWSIAQNRAGSAGKMLLRSKIWRSPIVSAFRSTRRWFIKALNRTEWKVKALGLDNSPTTAADPGLILIQIDGLSRKEFERAIVNGKLPFLRWLMKREGYGVTSFYSGVPSTTPAVQAELFYGTKSAVPAFAYYRRESKLLTKMLHYSDVNRKEQELKEKSEGLLGEGSSYSNIYGGGAKEVHYSPSIFNWYEFINMMNPLRMTRVVLAHPATTIKTIVSLVVELIIGVFDGLQGILGGEKPYQEISFIFNRLAVSVGIRNLISAGAVLDATRGLPIIHANFLGYDEHAHRRGPHSHFAHWPLKGIDEAIRRIFIAATKSKRRDYDVWIYSDHGQQQTVSFESKQGRTIYSALEEVFDEVPQIEGGSSHATPSFREAFRSLLKVFSKHHLLPTIIPNDGLRIAAAGPFGHVYCPHRHTLEEREELARKMVEVGVPLVFLKKGAGELIAYNRDGRFSFPGEASSVLGEHPFLREVADDLTSLASHPDAGDFLISGWSPVDPPLTFHPENGSHGGPGVEETNGFALLPNRLIVQHSGGKGYWRPTDLRNEAFNYLNVGAQVSHIASPPTHQARPHSIRIVTYNVHSCVGIDGSLSPSRIARALAEYTPDVVALQELDVGRARSEHEDQAHTIADKLSMHLHFHPAMQIEEERYGDAVLSRYPMKVRRSEALPGLVDGPQLEPRGALWVEVQVGGHALQIITTHLGLTRQERKVQGDALLKWIDDAERFGPVILCGDFNSFPNSELYNQLNARLPDVESTLDEKRPSKTWPSSYPCFRIDYVFAGREFRVKNVSVPRTTLTRLASDHLPLVVDIELPALSTARDLPYRHSNSTEASPAS